MEAILAKRSPPFNFSAIAGYPHPVSTINEWDDYHLRFKGSKLDHHGEHLLKFHICILEHGFFHKDVLTKMLKFFLRKMLVNGVNLSLLLVSIL
jgi:hypothetical protein